MKKVVTTGKTVEEAVERALQKLDVPRERVHIRVLTQPSKGLFRIIGVREAEVEVEVIPDPVEDTKNFLLNVIQTMGLRDIRLEHKEEGGRNHRFYIYGSNPGILIGRHGSTLDSLQYLVNLVANKYSDSYLHITLDVEDYRGKRKESLEKLAARVAQKVIQTRREVVLEPMSAYERKIIHSFLQNHPKVVTVSKGEEPYRQLVISPR